MYVRTKGYCAELLELKINRSSATEWSDEGEGHALYGVLRHRSGRCWARGPSNGSTGASNPRCHLSSPPDTYGPFRESLTSIHAAWEAMREIARRRRAPNIAAGYTVPLTTLGLIGLCPLFGRLSRRKYLCCQCQCQRQPAHDPIIHIVRPAVLCAVIGVLIDVNLSCRRCTKQLLVGRRRPQIKSKRTEVGCSPLMLRPCLHLPTWATPQIQIYSPFT